MTENSGLATMPCNGCGIPILFIQTRGGVVCPADAEVRQVITLDGNLVKGHIVHTACPGKSRVAEANKP